MQKKLTKTSAVLATAAAVVVAGGSLAVATVTGPIDGAGQVHACYTTKNGSLRVVNPTTACANSEAPLQWNQTGPQGPAGPQGAVGPQGPAGPQGARGPSDAWATGSSVQLDVNSPGVVETVSRNIPAGSFMFIGSVDLTNPNNIAGIDNAMWVQCSVMDNIYGVSTTQVFAQTVKVDGAGTGKIMGFGWLTLSQPSRAYMDCAVSNGQQATWRPLSGSAKIAAIQIDALH